MAIVFFSYSHKDEVLRNELEAHLALLKHEGFITAWHDRRIVAGDEVDPAILDKLETADIVLLLVSSDFISSPYCYSREMMRAMERHDAGEARVIPVILRDCDWKSAPFGKLLAAPRDGKPVVSWPDRDEAFADVAKQVRQAVQAARISVGSTSPISMMATRPAPSTPEKVSLPRSSNLRLRQEFTEKDADDFLRSSFEYISKFFQGSVEAIGERNAGVNGTFERIDSRRLAAVLYRRDKKIAQCSVRLDGLTRTNGIAFSYDASAAQGSFNEMLTVEAGEQSLHFKPMGIAWHGAADRDLSQEGAAEYLWELFIKQAQS